MEREEKVTVKTCTLKNLCFRKKVLFLIICGKNLTDACIGYTFLTDAFASIASAWIRPCSIRAFTPDASHQTFHTIETPVDLTLARPV